MRDKAPLLITRDPTLRSVFGNAQCTPDALALKVELVAGALATRDQRGAGRATQADRAPLWSAGGLAALARELAPCGPVTGDDILATLGREADAHGAAGVPAGGSAFIEKAAALRAALKVELPRTQIDIGSKLIGLTAPIIGNPDEVGKTDLGDNREPG